MKYNKLHKMVDSFSKLAADPIQTGYLQEGLRNPGDTYEGSANDANDLSSAWEALKAATDKFLDTFDRVDGQPNIRTDRSLDARVMMWNSLEKLEDHYAELLMELDPNT